jgi:propanediol dehydratase small subunit
MNDKMENPRYPLGEHAAREIRTATDRPLEDLNLKTVMAGEISAEDLRIHADTLRAQAEIARQAGYLRLAANLNRAAELTGVPNEELLKMYEALRPGRSTYRQLIALAEYLEQTFSAQHTGQFVREAAGVYRKRRLVRPEAE